MYSVEFDGVDDYLALPPIPDVQALAFWLFISSEQATSPNALLDTRSDAFSQGPFILSGRWSPLWSSLHVDATSAGLNWESFPRDKWTHVVLQLFSGTSDAFHFMGSLMPQWEWDSTVPNRNLGGRVSDVALWQRNLAAPEIDLLAQGLHYRRRLLQLGPASLWDDLSNPEAVDAFYLEKAKDMVQPFEKPAIDEAPIRQAFVETEPNAPDPIPPPKQSKVQQLAPRPRPPKVGVYYLEHIDEGC
eukprot:gene25670-biopygen26565